MKKVFFAILVMVLISCQSETEAIIEAYVVDNINDPSSYEPIETKAPNENGWAWQKYRATNGFGAVVTEEMYFKIKDGVVTGSATPSQYQLMQTNNALEGIIEDLEE